MNAPLFSDWAEFGGKVPSGLALFSTFLAWSRLSLSIW
jgi:hypothetical protein